ncbi:MAG: RHS repeat-associated core domain-containing protein [Bacteroidota bacterium]
MISAEYQSISYLDRYNENFYHGKWGLDQLQLFNHLISINIPTGNLVLTGTDILYPYYDFEFGIRRKYDLQEQHKIGTTLLTDVNASSNPHWFSNWQFNLEAGISSVWKGSCGELNLSTNLGIGGFFEQFGKDFRNGISNPEIAKGILGKYGIPKTTLEISGWSFKWKDVLLRTIQGPFRILSGEFENRTAIDDLVSRLWLFEPLGGKAFKLSSEFFSRQIQDELIAEGPPLIINSMVDQLGHKIELSPASDEENVYVLTDRSGRQIRMELNESLTFLSKSDPARSVSRPIVSSIIDMTKIDHNLVRYSYDEKRRLSRIDFPSTIGGHFVQYNYNEQFLGVISSIESSHGKRVSFEYIEDINDCDDQLNPRLKIKRIIDPEGIEFHYDYDHRNNLAIVTIQDGSGLDRTTRFRYEVDYFNSKRRFITETSTEVSRGFYLNSMNNVVSRSHESRQTIRSLHKYSNDRRFNKLQEADSLGRTISYKYNDFNQIVEMVDYQGNKTFFRYDNPNELVPPENPSKLKPFRYDLVQLVKENVRRTIDSDNNLIVENVLQTKTYSWSSYDSESSNFPEDLVYSTHRLLSEIDERGKVWTMGYNDPINSKPLEPTLFTSPLGSQSAITYSNRGERLVIKDADGNEFRNEYNEQGKLVSFINPNNEKVTLRYYDCCSLLKEFEDQEGHITQLVRSENGQVRRIVDPSGDTVDFEYYVNGRLHKIIEQRPSIPEDPGSGSLVTIYSDITTELWHTPLGELKSLSNANNLKLTFQYDEAGRRYQWGFEAISTPHQRFIFDPVGRTVGMVDAKGDITTLDYHSPSGFLKSISFPPWNNGEEDINGKTVEFTAHDYLGRLFTLKDSEFSEDKEFIYDDAGNLTFIKSTRGFVFQKFYDDDNRLYKISTLDRIFEQIFDLDTIGRSERVSDSTIFDGELSWNYDFQIDLAGIVKGMNLYGLSQPEIGLQISYDYNRKNLMSSINYRFLGETEPLFAQDLQYDDNSQVSRIQGDNSNEFVYDSLKQLVSDNNSNLVWDYDPVGNLLSQVNLSSLPLTEVNRYGPLNELLFSTTLGKDFKYDQNGNMVEEGAGDKQFYFDGSGKLRRVVVGDILLDYLYNEEGHLVKRTRTNLISAEIATYEFTYWDGKLILIEKDGNIHSMLTWDNHNMLLRLRKPNLRLGGPRESSLFPVYDALGNIVKLLDSQGDVVATRSFDSWGNIELLTDPNSYFQFLGFQDGFHDNSTDLINFGARWYYPAIKRWISPDSIVNAVNPFLDDLSNLYKFVSNNPINKFDRTGLSDKVSKSEEIDFDTLPNPHASPESLLETERKRRRIWERDKFKTPAVGGNSLSEFLGGLFENFGSFFENRRRGIAAETIRARAFYELSVTRQEHWDLIQEFRKSGNFSLDRFEVIQHRIERLNQIIGAANEISSPR